MKNITIESLNNGMGCLDCNDVGFISYVDAYECSFSCTPDFASCPNCGNSYRTLDQLGRVLKFIGVDKFCIYYYCHNCHIVYDYEDVCLHNENKDKKSLPAYYGTLVSKWKYQGKIYDGMMQFDSFEECKEKCTQIEILDAFCSCKQYNCKRCVKDTYQDANSDCECI